MDNIVFYTEMRFVESHFTSNPQESNLSEVTVLELKIHHLGTPSKEHLRKAAKMAVNRFYKKSSKEDRSNE